MAAKLSAIIQAVLLTCEEDIDQIFVCHILDSRYAKMHRYRHTANFTVQDMDRAMQAFTEKFRPRGFSKVYAWFDGRQHRIDSLKNWIEELLEEGL